MEIQSPWLEPCVQRLLVKGAWCLSKLMRKGLCWPHCQIWRYFFQGLDDLFKIMFWSTHLTVGHQEDPMGTLGFKEQFLELGWWGWESRMNVSGTSK